MIDAANLLEASVKVNRTKTSKEDTLIGILGEYVFAEYFYGDWKKNNVGLSKGKFDFKQFEIKTSASPFSERLHLLVRGDYALKRKPPYYVQVFLFFSFHQKVSKVLLLQSNFFNPPPHVQIQPYTHR